MKFVLLKVSDSDFREVIDINTLEDLKGLQEKYGYELIIYCAKTTDEIEDNRYTCSESDGRYIEIYDNHRD